MSTPTWKVSFRIIAKFLHISCKLFTGKGNLFTISFVLSTVSFIVWFFLTTYNFHESLAKAGFTFLIFLLLFLLPTPWKSDKIGCSIHHSYQNITINTSIKILHFFNMRHSYYKERLVFIWYFYAMLSSLSYTWLMTLAISARAALIFCHRCVPWIAMDLKALKPW